MGIIQTLSRLRTWHFLLLAVIAAEILTFLLNSLQGLVRWGGISWDLVEIGAIDAVFVSLAVTAFMIPIVRYSSKIILERDVLQKEVAERRSAEAALQRSEGRYRAIVENQAEFVCRYLPDGTVTFANDTLCRYCKRNVKTCSESPFSLLCMKTTGRCLFGK